MNYTDINAKAIDRWVDEGWKWGQPITHETFIAAKEGNWQVLLSPLKPVPKNWFPDLKDKKILGLAAGGGQQMPIFAACGADCTVMDFSDKQLESEKILAKKEGYQINIINGDMTKEFPFENASFDIVFHPVSNCYIKDVNHVWQECARVLKSGGILMAGFDNGLNFLFDENDESHIIDYLPFDPLTNKKQLDYLLKNDYAIQFSHNIEELIAGQIHSGFELLDIYDDTNDEGFLMEHGVPTYWVTLSRKK